MTVIVDMNLSPDWIPAFELAGIKATHWSRIGAITAPDIEIIQFARECDSVILTNDLDFGGHLAASNAPKPSVVLLRMEELDPAIVGSEVIAIMLAMKGQLERGALITIKPSRTRSRLLPFRVK